MSKTSSNNTKHNSERVTTLMDLIAGRGSLSDVHERLWKFTFDSEPLITMRSSHIVDILKRFLDNEVTEDYVQCWADLIEVRDDIAYDATDASIIKEAIHQLSNPELYGPLDRREVDTLIRRLSSGNSG